MNFLKKTIIGILLASATLVFLLYLRQFSVIWLDVLMMLYTLPSIYEMDHAFRKCGYKTIRPVIIMATVLFYPMFLLLGFHGIVMTMILSFMTGAVIMTFNHNINYKDLAMTAFILIYPLFFYALFTEINHNTGGLFGVLSILVIALFSDLFAQWIGMIVKGKKLCPSISPKKTRAGACGAYIGGLIGAGILFLTFEYYQLFKTMPNVNFTGLTSSPLKSLPIYIGLALVGSTVSQLGDLFASWLKRQFDIKDYGTVLPGHGGVMDRTDSLLFTAPIFYLIFLFIPALAQ